MSKLDEFCDSLQKKIYAKTEQDLGKEFLERWLEPKFMGKLSKANKIVKVKPSCGKVLEVYFFLEKDRVKEIAFFTDGCGSDIVCAEIACELALNKSKEEILALTEDDILTVVPKLALSSRSAAKAPIQALKEAFV